MKVIPGFALRPLGNEYLLIAESVELVNFNAMITLNESAAYLWRNVAEKESFDAQTLAELLLEEYEVSPEQALEDAKKTIASWQEAKIIAD
ncbi:MAG: PqqD family protein [Paludibacteraceae bacterium]|nr:PqqD family protein [Paludibacteraceae bacterium]